MSNPQFKNTLNNVKSNINGNFKMSNKCEALSDFLIEFFKANRFKNTPKYDEALNIIVTAFSYNAPYDQVVMHMIDNNIPLKATNIIKLLENNKTKKATFSNDEEEYNFICRKSFEFLAGLLGISRLNNKKDKMKYATILLSLLTVDTNWNAVWTLFLSRRKYTLKDLTQIVIEVVFDELNIPMNLISGIKIKKIGKNTYTIVLKVTKDYLRIIDAKQHSKLKEKLGNLLIEL